MSSKSKRPSTGSNTYSSNRKHHIRDLSVSSNDDAVEAQSQDQPSDVDSEKKKQTTPLKPKAKTTSKPAVNDVEANDDEENQSEEEKEYEVETIKDHRHHGKTIQYLVGWKGYSSEDDSWEPPKHLTGALDLLKNYKIKHGLDSKPKNRASNVSAKSTSKKTGKNPDPDPSEGSGEEDHQISRKRKRLSADIPKSAIAPLRKSGANGPTKADRASVANRKSDQLDSDASEDGADSVDQDEWHARHKKLASWEDLIRSVRTIEKPSNADDEQNSTSSTSHTINVCLLWKTGRTTWVSNKTARAKLPQKLLDFYEAHLQFSPAEN